MGTKKAKQTETDIAYAQLHQGIVGGALMPNQRMIELELADQLGVGRAAVRTAIDRLTQDGLVEREPNRGARVRLVSLAEAVEMLEVRAVLEGLALRYAAVKATKQDIASLQASLDRMEQALATEDLPALSAINAKFHAMLLDIADNGTVAQLLERLQANHVRFQHRMILVPGRAVHSLQEHHVIVDAVADHDADAAEAAMRQHLQHAAEALRESNAAAKQWPVTA